ncbi:MAG TPA: TonB-dependent receptor [Chitinophagaceae bacterium]|nr:TonB-dependent receptor [Chitinophagaceae bacterium]
MKRKTPPLVKLTSYFSLSILLLLFAFVANAQKQVNGTVKSPTGPVAGATVVVKSTNVATQSDASGKFSIMVPEGKSVLVISFVGLDTKEVDVSKTSEVDVLLPTVISTLNEVVITGYTAQRKKDVTGSVSIVNIADMKQMPVGTGEEGLQGRASGITVTSSGQPGAASDIRIRGVTSFGNNAPLVIVDGVRGNLHDINVNDVESIQILKDAAAAIYGVAGSNGVVIVTTKKGKTGKAKVTYDFYYGVTQKGPGFDMANTQEEANAIWLQQKNSGIANPSDKQFGKGATPVIPDYIQTFPYQDPSSITPSLINYGYTGSNPNIIGPDKYDINSAQITQANKQGTDWYDEITRNAKVQSHNISVSSGSDKSSYFFSVGYLNQEGILQTQYLKRYSVRANTQFTVKDHLRIGENAYIFYKDNPTFLNQSESSPFTTAYRESAIIPVYDIMGNFAGTKSQGLGNARNPYADIYRTKDNRGYNWDITGNVYAELDFLKHFTARTSFGGVMDLNHNYSFGYVGYENAEGNTGSNSFNEGGGYNTSWTFTNTLTYANIFKEHNVKVLLGTEAVNSYGRWTTAGRSLYFSENPNYWTLNAGTGSQSNAGGAYQSTLLSQFARLEYAYSGKYLINASVRRDGTSIFTEEQRWGVFPSVSAAWRISEENFFKGITFVNDLKIRYSWGKMGSTSNVDPTNPYNLYSTRAGKSAYDIGGTSTNPYVGFFRSNLGNAETTWEGDIISNFGIDATILKNRLDFSIDYYQKKVNGLLFTQSGVPVDIIFAGDAGLPKVNIGDIQNTGIDFSATYHAMIGKDLKLDLSGTLTSYNNKIVDIPGVPFFDGATVRNVKIQRFQEGQAFGAFFGYKVLGLFQDAADVTKSPTQDGAEPGVFKYQDVNGDGKINTDDRTFIGDPNPDFTYSFNISATYKNFDFGAFFFGSKGNDIFNNTLYFTDFPDFFKGGLRREVALNSWTPTNTNTSIPKLKTTGSFSTDNSGFANSYFISKGSYLRSKLMQIGYTIPQNKLSRFGIDRLRLYFQATNLFTITDYKGLDPELPSQPNSNGQIVNTYQYGIDQGSYPNTPRFLFGINLNF